MADEQLVATEEYLAADVPVHGVVEQVVEADPDVLVRDEHEADDD